MTVATDTLRELLDRPRGEGHTHLLESEGVALLKTLGIGVPDHCVVSGPENLSQLQVTGERLVLKALSFDIQHKSELGALAVVDRAELGSAMESMRERLSDIELDGFLVESFVPYENALGAELLVALRYTEDFGPVFVVGPGGVHTELLNKSLRPGMGTVIRATNDPGRLAHAWAETPIGRVTLEGHRGRPPIVPAGALERFLASLQGLLPLMPERIREIEINPAVVSGDELVALDALVRLGDGSKPDIVLRPLHKLPHLLKPKSIALMGVSERMNPGHVILRNMLEMGYPRENISVVKSGRKELDGCRCVEDLSHLPNAVDLLVLAVSAGQLPAIMRSAIEWQIAESMIVIPGGLDESSDGEEAVTEIRDTLRASRATSWGGPLVNGANCLGIRSHPGRYDTMFIPGRKIGRQATHVAPVAFLSQSGAFAISKHSKLSYIDPKYTISIGNQMDLTISDFLEYLADDQEIEVFAVYVEGFKPLDGLRFAQITERLTRQGRTVILYRAGRTTAGARATASHTASIAGDFEVGRQLCDAAGVIEAQSLADFEDLLAVSLSMRTTPLLGTGVGAISNAGFECVAIADTAGDFELVDLSPATRRRIEWVLHEHRLEGIVDTHNPMDVTPQMDDDGYVHVARAILQDARVDVGVFACVPLTPALGTLAQTNGGGEDVTAPNGLPSRLADLQREIEKPIMAVVDGGELYDPMVDAFRSRGVATFRTADRALRILGEYCRRSCPREID